MSASLQLTIMNSTPQQRRVFVLWRSHDTADADAIALGAWQSFMLAPGESDYTAVASRFQLTARSLVPDIQGQTLLVDSDLGVKWSFQLGDDTAPTLVTVDQRVPAGSIGAENRTTGDVVLQCRNNFSPIWPEVTIGPDTNAVFQPAGALFFYVSVAVVDEEQPIVLEPMAGHFAFDGRAQVNAKFRQDGDTREWQIG
jgi:hypothetical protein